ncbi:hypothetical protein E2C01_003377 [Portunus trituberculatus]|uniref:Uncharacterized protein n=1 Tax=Portunus trituberculatus TaxID=210409 RepID=A0A5B7CM75_PORTR|nr:hypothetical protein [Portunus trituberculatus]
MEEERDNEVSGRGVAWGGTVAPSAHYHRGETDDNAHNAAAEQAATDEGGEFSCSASSSTSEPLLRRRAPGYVVPYFPESESEVRDASPTEPLFPRSEAGRQAGGGGGSLGGGCGGYVAPSECHWLPGTSGYVAVQHGHDTGASAPGYVQADAFPHATVAPGAADARNCPAEGHWYVGLDSPVVGGDPARSQDPPDLTHDPVTCVTPAIPSPDSPAPSHDPGVPSLVSMSPGGGERNAEAQEQGKPSYVALPDAQLSMKWLEADHAASCDNKPSYVTLPDAQHSMTWLEADQVTSSDVEPSYVSLPDAQLSMKWQSGDLATPGDGKLCAKESERQEKPPCPPGGTPAPGYIAVQPPDFGKPAEESTRLMEKGLDLEPYLPDDDFMSAMLLKPKHALAMPHSALPAAFPAVFPGALEVPNVAHKPDVPSTGDVPGEAQERYNLLAGTAEVGEYLPLPELATDDKSDTNTTRNSWLASLLPSASLSPLTPTQHPATGISFVMLSNLFSRSDKSDESDLKESEMNAYSDTDERAENEENEAAENEIHALVDLPEGYSRVGDEE